MPQYQAPLRDMQFVLHELLNAESVFKGMPAYADIDTDADTINSILEEAAKFAQNVTFPLNQSGDQEGCHHDKATGAVTAPKGFKEAYKQYVEGGWPALACDPAYGGQGLPETVNTVFYEMLNSANQAWTMYPGLTHGAYAALIAHGTDELKATYLPKMISGEWTGTMCLTEPHCGTDLGMLRTKAEPKGDGSYAISGTKIFISSGDHDMADNIIHLVLARLPDAPAGTKGISLFIVPKFLATDGSRNGIKCGSIEHKMGIHGNATCVMNLDEATGYMVGEPNKGLNAMFVMMNGARLGVGCQSLGLGEVAYQNSLAYAKDRLQMRSLSGVKAKDKPADPIIVHPDVRRMLLTQKAYTEGARAFVYWVGLMIDTEHHGSDDKAKKEASDLVALLTPIIKAFITDNTLETTNMGLQCFGGHGYVAEWGMEQYVRDARINLIYEGTNGIQALDLLGRKVLGDMGAKLMKFGKLVTAFIKENEGDEALKTYTTALAALGAEVTKITTEIGMKAMKNPDEVGAASVAYMRIVGHFVYAYLWARMAKLSLGKDEPFYQAKIATANFYFAKLLPETAMHFQTIRAGGDTLMALDAANF
jgi:hypothetical protein